MQGGKKIALLAAFEQGIAQIAGGDEARGQLRDFAFFLFNDGVEDGHAFNGEHPTTNIELPTSN
jgi:hypothetical protein